MRIAVIGTGVSGNVAARLLSYEHDLHVFEANSYIGGHSNTVDANVAGVIYPVDTGFMVYNDRTYPNFCRLLDWLGVEGVDSDMSFSVRCDVTGLEYQGSSLNGLFADRRNLVRPGFWRLLRDIMRFNRLATEAVHSDQLASLGTVGDFVDKCRVGDSFVDRYLVPMAAAIWSSEPDRILQFPAQFFLGFCHNHGLIQVKDRPQWRILPGGSRVYVEKLTAPIRDRIRLNTPVASVNREAGEVRIRTVAGQEECFDRVVFATHANTTLRLLQDASSVEREILGHFPYQSNEAVLHTDLSLMPRRQRAWASWNYLVPQQQQDSVAVTYDLSRLQHHDSATPILLTLNHSQAIDSDKVLQRIQYEHPIFGPETDAAQARYDEINGVNNTYYCGAYWGYGFHEDGVKSGLAVARAFGTSLDTCIAASTKEPSLTAVTSP